MAAELHISISAEKLFSIGGLDITNSMFTSVVVSFILILFAFIVNSKLKKTSKPSGLQNFAEMIIEALHEFVHGVTGDLKKTRLFFPFISTFFLVIILNNWLGLIPGVGTVRLLVNEETSIETEYEADEHSLSIVDSAHASETEIEHETTTNNQDNEDIEHDTTEETDAHHGPTAVPIFRPGTADINTTLAFAIISLVLTQIFGVKYLKLGYFKKFINFSSPIMFFVGILELISEFAKIVSFAFRLFGNIFAGEVLLVVMAFLFPLILPMPFYGLEIFVGFIQALVFSMLTLVFFNMATVSHEEH
jgi:F-type H+-transporting ATPase subunit a